jgi:hypothetical protein
MKQIELYDQYMMATNGWFHIEESMSSQARKTHE